MFYVRLSIRGAWFFSCLLTPVFNSRFGEFWGGKHTAWFPSSPVNRDTSLFSLLFANFLSRGHLAPLVFLRVVFRGAGTVSRGLP